MNYELFTNPGSREINEDRIGLAMHGDSYCFVVADGLGGHGNGEVAAQKAMDAVCGHFLEFGYSDDFFDMAYQKAQKAIIKEQEEQLAFSKMKTTLVILILHEGKAYISHVGDSRAYVFKNNKLKKRTIDHSVPQMLALSGNIKEQEIRFHPDRNRLMRVMGIKGEEPRYETEVPLKMNQVQAFLLCTDGFWEFIDEATMEKLLRQSTSAKEWIEKMETEIKGNGIGKEMDNFTAAVIFMDKRKWFW